MESQRPCSLDYIKGEISIKKEKLNNVNKFMRGTEDVPTILNAEEQVKKLKKDIDILYDYAFLRFGINLRLIDVS